MRTAASLAICASMAVSLAACGDGAEDDDLEAQPGPDVTRFVEGDFGDLPIPPLAEPTSDRSEEDDVTVRSYLVRNKTPEDVLDFYAKALADTAEIISEPASSGRTSWKGEWRLADGRALLVTAIPAPAAGVHDFAEDTDPVTQFSLTLRD